MTNESDLQSQMQAYREAVSRYEALDAEIDQLFATQRGGAEKMSDDDLVKYRQLARQRDELLNEMRIREVCGAVRNNMYVLHSHLLFGVALTGYRLL